MERLISEIRAAVQGGAWILALQGSMACIDICAALASQDGRTSRTHFKQWFQQHLAQRYPNLSDSDVYQLRCGLLHQGRAAGSQYSALIFTLPLASGNYFHNNVINDALNLDLGTFCNDVLDVAENWWQNAQGTEPVKTNAEALLQIRPQGLAPYMVGMPVLA